MNDNKITRERMLSAYDNMSEIGKTALRGLNPAAGDPREQIKNLTDEQIENLVTRVTLEK